MKPVAKANLIIVCYCVFLWLTNWTLTHTYDRKAGLTSDSHDYRPLGVLIGVVMSYVLARRIWRLFRDLLDQRIRIPSGRRIWGSWTVLILLLPMFWSYRTEGAGTADDGAAMTTIFEYGGGASIYSVLFSALAIMLFQTLVNMEAYCSENAA